MVHSVPPFEALDLVMLDPVDTWNHTTPGPAGQRRPTYFKDTVDGMLTQYYAKGTHILASDVEAYDQTNNPAAVWWAPSAIVRSAAVLFSPSPAVSVTLQPRTLLDGGWIAAWAGGTKSPPMTVQYRNKTAAVAAALGANSLTVQLGCHCRLLRSTTCGLPMHYDSFFRNYTTFEDYSPLWNLMDHSRDEVVQDWWDCLPGSEWNGGIPSEYTVTVGANEPLQDGYYLMLSTCSANVTLSATPTLYPAHWDSAMENDPRFKLELPPLWSRPSHSYFKVDTVAPEVTIKPVRGDAAGNTTVYRPSYNPAPADLRLACHSANTLLPQWLPLHSYEFEVATYDPDSACQKAQPLQIVAADEAHTKLSGQMKEMELAILASVAGDKGPCFSSLNACVTPAAGGLQPYWGWVDSNFVPPNALDVQMSSGLYGGGFEAPARQTAFTYGMSAHTASFLFWTSTPNCVMPGIDDPLYGFYYNKKSRLAQLDALAYTEDPNFDYGRFRKKAEGSGDVAFYLNTAERSGGLEGWAREQSLISGSYTCINPALCSAMEPKVFAHGYSPFVRATVGDLAGNRAPTPTTYTWHVASETTAGAGAGGSFLYMTEGPEGWPAVATWTPVEAGNLQAVSNMSVSGLYGLAVVGVDQWKNFNTSYSNSIDWNVDLDGPVCELTEGYQVTESDGSSAPGATFQWTFDALPAYSKWSSDNASTFTIDPVATWDSSTGYFMPALKKSFEATELVFGHHSFAVLGKDILGNVGGTCATNFEISPITGSVTCSGVADGVNLCTPCAAGVGAITGATFDRMRVTSRISYSSVFPTVEPNFNAGERCRLQYRLNDGTWVDGYAFTTQYSADMPLDNLGEGVFKLETRHVCLWFVENPSDAAIVQELRQYEYEPYEVAFSPAVFALTQSKPTCVYFRADQTAPNIDFEYSPPATCGSDPATNGPTFSGSLDDPTATVHYKIVELGEDASDVRYEPFSVAPFVAISAELLLPGQISVNPTALTFYARLPHLADGVYTLYGIAIDEAGNVGPEIKKDFVIDCSAPETMLHNCPGLPALVGRQLVSLSCDEPPCSYYYRLDTDKPDSWSFTNQTMIEIDSSAGTHSLWVKAVDADANVDMTPAICTWTAYTDDEFQDTLMQTTLLLAGPRMHTKDQVLGLGNM